MPTLKEIVDNHGLPVKVKKNVNGFTAIYTIEYKLSNNQYAVTYFYLDASYTTDVASAMVLPGIIDVELYTEPKKKKVLYKWLMGGSTSSKKYYYEASLYYETSEQVELYEMKKPIKRLDYTRVEVEE